MERHWLKREGNDTLLIIVLGWAADWQIVRHIQPAGYDVVCVYDYRHIEVDNSFKSEISEVVYPNRYLVAWSFGVWVAEHIFAGQQFARAIAFNGTPLPVDELYGIAPRIMDVTIRGLERGGMEQFNKRAYGAFYDEFAEWLSPRSLEENIEELKNLNRLSLKPYHPSIEWDKAIVGSEDLIFSPENMKRFWGERAQMLPLSHYPFAEEKLIIDNLEER